ncbi:MAG: AarF/ABC1/UbiB kinase family protein [Nocardioidaceae bacterium]|nr:AarF/ABC1/UbiB kinase family protein [Nocardioidaceae bacterium]NUS53054.1 AarF/ABC1/UbiB kinase family protein [Nocardioidaceae bacterium]
MSRSLKVRHGARYARLAALLVKHARSGMIRPGGAEPTAAAGADLADGDPEAAAELARELESLGPTYVKLGQMMSTRVDLISPAYVEGLSRLQDDVEPFGYDEVERIVTSELGVRLPTLFPEFERKPLASASLGQVHRATLRDGRKVVVKVQRPDVRERVVRDMEVLGEIVDVVDAHTELGSRFAVAELLEEFRRTLFDELDYRREGENLLTLREILSGWERLAVPEAYLDLCTERVLTMEYLPGRKVTELGPLARLEIEGEALADDLFGAYVEQVLVEGVFHADPHPGNVLVTDDGRLVLLDVGMVSRVTPARQEKLLKLLLALADTRPDEVVRVARTLGEERPGYDQARFERAVARVVRQAATSSLEQIDLGVLLLRLIRDAGDCGLRMDPELTMLGKAILNLDQVATVLDPDFQPIEALHRHGGRLMRSSMRASPAALLSSMLEAKEFAEALPGRVNRAFDAIGEGRFELRIKAFDEHEFLRGLHKLANVIAAGLVLAAIILASALLARPGDKGPSTVNTIAFVVFVIAVATALVMLARNAWQSHRLRRRR